MPAKTKPAALRRTIQFTIRLAQGDAESVLKAARLRGKHVTDFNRDAIVRMANSTLMMAADEIEQERVRKAAIETMMTGSGGSSDET